MSRQSYALNLKLPGVESTNVTLDDLPEVIKAIHTLAVAYTLLEARVSSIEARLLAAGIP